ncbi:cbb3-type cytochrome oxidase subunit 3 [Neisseria perflava]|uniref:cbb3-type cytochrome oxidase subunit 3 n=1 Tax=Neisseria perflava TaxID=33053 RepID=UPI00209C77CF|nr:CcoQ/FixQ family Cbb3-type cytochrome c oxidase assembly chaperone [Neisseria perflava]MCP1659164.1 cytochrome c oxidase cbb3-type subunit 4 [Neisseria perflava]MCP1773319.1 cytochrome c oxidase cbb3-type subunit 4 [Neisseria perflava]
MGINWVRTLFTLWIFISFVLVIYIVFNRRNKGNYDEAASSIFDDDENSLDNKNGQ